MINDNYKERALNAEKRVYELEKEINELKETLAGKLSKLGIELLKSHSDITCSICLDQDQDKQNNLASLKKCSHHFHLSCILKWFSCNLSCPSCRSNPIS
jgi:hypothetical protein